MTMMLSRKNRKYHTECGYGCCTDFPRTGRANRTRRRMMRAREGVRWKRDGIE